MRRTTLLLSVVFLALATRAFPQDLEVRKVFSTAPVDGGLAIEVGGRTFGPFAGLEGPAWFPPEGKNWAMVVRKSGGAFAILVNGVEKAVYAKEYVRCWDVSTSPDGGAWAVRAELASNARTRQVVVVDGKAQGPFDQIDEFGWSPAGRGWYLKARTGESTYVVRGGKKYGPFQDARGACFDAAGARFAVAELKADGWWIRLDEKEYGPCPEAEVLRTDDGAYFGSLATQKNGSRVLTVGTTAYGPYSYVDWGRQHIGPGGKDWLVMVFRGAKRILLQNGKETELNRLSVYRLAKGWMYTYEKGGLCLVFNGKPFGPYGNGRDLTVTRDGSSWALRFDRGVGGVEQPFVAVDGVEYPGTAFARAADAGGEYVAWVSGGVDGDAVYHRYAKGHVASTLYQVKQTASGVTVSAGEATWGPYRGIACNPWASPDGAHWGLLATLADGRCVALVDGTESAPLGPYARVYDFTIGDDGAGWGFTAVPDAAAPSSVREVIAGREYGPFSWVDRPRFGARGSFAFWAISEGKTPRGILVLDGTAWGPFAGDFASRLVDVPAGTFALESRAKTGTTLQVKGDLLGPWREVWVLRRGPRSDGDYAGYFGFVAVLDDGSRELHVNGGGVYGPYRRLDAPKAWLPADGTDWIVLAEKPGDAGQVFVRAGVEVPTMGVDLRPWGDGFLLFVRQESGESFVWKDGEAGPYTGVRGVLASRDGGTWASEASKGDGAAAAPVVVVNGREYPGQALRHVDTAAAEYFTWFSTDAQGAGYVSTLKLR